MKWPCSTTGATCAASTNAQMRNSRQARNLVSAAEWHVDHVQDHVLADELRQWLAIKPRLV